MEENLQDIVKLIARYRMGELSEEELKRLMEWRKEQPLHEQLFLKFSNEWQVAAHLQKYETIDINKAWKKNQHLLKGHFFRKIIRKSLPYAALIVIALAVLFVWRENKALPVQEELLAQPALPGSCKAELILANGEKVLLQAGVETHIREGVTDIRISGNSVNYFSDSTADAVAENIIRTPLGGEYSIILADGTKVWLNALSELKYPVDFKGPERRVSLKGEAYFEVSRDSARPFYVTVDDYQIKVLGTSFNITAYADQSFVQTTLCSGKVDVRDVRLNRSVVLYPNEQIYCDRQNNQMEVRKVDTELYTAWTRGEFRFDNTSVEDIFKILQRWYRIEVCYANPRVREEVFSGKLPRFDNLKTILDIMAKVSDVSFELKGNTLVVK